MKLSEHFSLAEFTRSATASRLGLSNAPTEPLTDVLKDTAGALERVRALLDRRINISSGYRSPAVNRAVRGSPTSAHCLGYAIDFNVAGLSPYEVCTQIAESGIVFDQLIHEFGSWTHFSFDPRARRQSLTIASARQGYKSGILKIAGR